MAEPTQTLRPAVPTLQTGGLTAAAPELRAAPTPPTTARSGAPSPRGFVLKVPTRSFQHTYLRYDDPQYQEDVGKFVAAPAEERTAFTERFKFVSGGMDVNKDFPAIRGIFFSSQQQTGSGGVRGGKLQVLTRVDPDPSIQDSFKSLRAAIDGAKNQGELKAVLEDPQFTKYQALFKRFLDGNKAAETTLPFSFYKHAILSEADLLEVQLGEIGRQVAAKPGQNIPNYSESAATPAGFYRSSTTPASLQVTMISTKDSHESSLNKSIGYPAQVVAMQVDSLRTNGSLNRALQRPAARPFVSINPEIKITTPLSYSQLEALESVDRALSVMQNLSVSGQEGRGGKAEIRLGTGEGKTFLTDIIARHYTGVASSIVSLNLNSTAAERDAAFSEPRGRLLMLDEAFFYTPEFMNVAATAGETLEQSRANFVRNLREQGATVILLGASVSVEKMQVEVDRLESKIARTETNLAYNRTSIADSVAFRARQDRGMAVLSGFLDKYRERKPSEPGYEGNPMVSAYWGGASGEARKEVLKRELRDLFAAADQVGVIAERQGTSLESLLAQIEATRTTDALRDALKVVRDADLLPALNADITREKERLTALRAESASSTVLLADMRVMLEGRRDQLADLVERRDGATIARVEGAEISPGGTYDIPGMMQKLEARGPMAEGQRLQYIMPNISMEEMSAEQISAIQKSSGADIIAIPHMGAAGGQIGYRVYHRSPGTEGFVLSDKVEQNDLSAYISGISLSPASKVIGLYDSRTAIGGDQAGLSLGITDQVIHLASTASVTSNLLMQYDRNRDVKRDGVALTIASPEDSLTRESLLSSIATNTAQDDRDRTIGYLLDKIEEFGAPEGVPFAASPQLDFYRETLYKLDPARRPRDPLEAATTAAAQPALTEVFAIEGDAAVEADRALVGEIDHDAETARIEAERAAEIARTAAEAERQRAEIVAREAAEKQQAEELALAAAQREVAERLVAEEQALANALGAADALDADIDEFLAAELAAAGITQGETAQAETVVAPSAPAEAEEASRETAAQQAAIERQQEEMKKQYGIVANAAAARGRELDDAARLRAAQLEAQELARGIAAQRERQLEADAKRAEIGAEQAARALAALGEPVPSEAARTLAAAEGFATELRNITAPVDEPVAEDSSVAAVEEVSAAAPNLDADLAAAPSDAALSAADLVADGGDSEPAAARDGDDAATSPSVSAAADDLAATTPPPSEPAAALDGGVDDAAASAALSPETESADLSDAAIGDVTLATAPGGAALDASLDIGGASESGAALGAAESLLPPSDPAPSLDAATAALNLDADAAAALELAPSDSAAAVDAASASIPAPDLSASVDALDAALAVDLSVATPDPSLSAIAPPDAAQQASPPSSAAPALPVDAIVGGLTADQQDSLLKTLNIIGTPELDIAGAKQGYDEIEAILGDAALSEMARMDKIAAVQANYKGDTSFQVYASALRGAMGAVEDASQPGKKKAEAVQSLRDGFKFLSTDTTRTADQAMGQSLVALGPVITPGTFQDPIRAGVVDGVKGYFDSRSQAQAQGQTAGASAAAPSQAAAGQGTDITHSATKSGRGSNEDDNIKDVLKKIGLGLTAFALAFAPAVGPIVALAFIAVMVSKYVKEESFIKPDPGISKEQLDAQTAYADSLLPRRMPQGIDPKAPPSTELGKAASGLTSQMSAEVGKVAAPLVPMQSSLARMTAAAQAMQSASAAAAVVSAPVLAPDALGAASDSSPSVSSPAVTAAAVVSLDTDTTPPSLPAPAASLLAPEPQSSTSASLDASSAAPDISAPDMPIVSAAALESSEGMDRAAELLFGGDNSAASVEGVGAGAPTPTSRESLAALVDSSVLASLAEHVDVEGTGVHATAAEETAEHRASASAAARSEGHS